MDDQDPARLRISDADRHHVAEVLREAAGEGRLELHELEERLEAAYSARIYADLVPILADLPGEAARLPVVPDPAAPVRRPVAPVAATRHNASFALMGGQDRKGVWEIGERHGAFALMGGIDIDLREAVFAAPHVDLTAVAIMGGIDVVVNAHTKVVVEGIGIMGAFGQGRDRVPAQVGPDSPVVRVRGFALMGGVGVVRRPMPGKGSLRRR